MSKSEDSKQQLDQKFTRDVEKKKHALGNPTIHKSEVEKRVRAGDALIIIQEMVFDVSTYINKHPGGAFILKNNYGRDSSEKFLRIHSKHAHQELARFYIGDVADSANQNGDGQHTGKEAEQSVHRVNEPDLQAPGPAGDLHSPRFGEYYEHQADLSKPTLDVQYSIDPHEIKANLIVGDTEVAAKAFHMHAHPFVPLDILKEEQEEDEVGKEDEGKTKSLEAGGQQDGKQMIEKLPMPKAQQEGISDKPASPKRSLGYKPTDQASQPRRSSDSGSPKRSPFGAMGSEHGMPKNHPPVPGHPDISKNGDNCAGCPFLALTKLPLDKIGSLQPKFPENAEEPSDNFTRSRSAGSEHGREDSEIGLSNSFKHSRHEEPLHAKRGSNRKLTGSFHSFKSEKSGAGGVTSYKNFYVPNGVAYESPRSMRSREDVSISSRHASTVFTAGESFAQRSQALQGTNLKLNGGVYRTRNRRKHAPIRRSNAPPVDMSEWKYYSRFIISSWNKLLKAVSYADLGTAIYESVKDNEYLEPLFRFTNPTVQGTKFVDMLSSIVENIENPVDIYVKIADLAPLHHRKGVKGSQMPLMQEIVLAVFRTSLGDDMLPEETKAWIWMWTYLGTSLDQTLKQVGSTLSVVRDSWEAVLEKYTPGELGEMVYDHLFRLAPNVASLFTKPREYMAVKMGDTLGMLVSFADDPENMKQQVSWLGIRHVQYNVRPHHIPLIGPVFMNVLADVSGEEWTEDVEKAWGIVFKMVCDNMSEAIQDGEDFASSLEHTTEFIEEHGDIQLLKRTLATELSTSCPSLFENNGTIQYRPKSDTMMSDSGSAVRTQSALSSGGHRNSITTNEQGVFSHLLHVSAQSANKSSKNENVGAALQRKGSIITMKKAQAFRKTVEGELHVGAEDALVSLIFEFVLNTSSMVWEPEKQVENIYIYAPKFYEQGMRSANVKSIGKAFESAMKHSLGDEWAEHMSDSFRWMWRMIADVLIKELDAIDDNRAIMIVANWELVQEKCELEEMGRIFWKHLNDVSPEQTHIFRRSLTMWGKLLKHIVETLLISIREPEEFFDQLFELTIRHIRYGVRSEYLSPFGHAMILTLEEILQDSWTAKIEELWKEVWKRAANSMTRGLNMGGNGITHALVEGNALALQAAISCAPRNVRADWLCQVDINGASISPLYWALHDGKFAIVEFILSDLLTIRADIHGYYYGRENLFRHHHDIVQILGKECLDLMPVLLDGLMWHSKEKLPGRKVRVNYYIRELYGDPDSYRDPWDSPLASYINLDDNQSFKHPVVKKTLELKWLSFGLKIFCLKETAYLVMLIAFMFGHVEDPTGCDSSHNNVRSFLTAVAIMSLLVQLYVVFRQIRKRITKVVGFGPFTVELPRSLTGLWNILRMTSCALILVNAASHDCSFDCSLLTNSTDCYLNNGTRSFDYQDVSYGARALLAAKAKSDGGTTTTTAIYAPASQRTVRSILAVLIWVQMFQISILSTPMAAFTFTIGIMFNDLSHSLFMILILMAAFGSALTILGDSPFDQGWDQTIVLLLQEVLGVAQPLYSDISALSRFMLLVFVLCVTIGMLNILIAQLTITYDKLTADKEGFAMKYRATICIEIESFLPMSWRRRFFNDHNFFEALPFSESDDGPDGGIQVLERDDCPRYVPDRVMRFTGDASPKDPWPNISQLEKSNTSPQQQADE